VLEFACATDSMLTLTVHLATDGQVSSLVVSTKKIYLSVVFASFLIRSIWTVYITHDQHVVIDLSLI